MNVVGPSGRIAPTCSMSSSAASRLLATSSTSNSLTPPGSTRTAAICELWMLIISPSSERSCVERSDRSSTIPWTSIIGIAIVSPTEYHFSTNMLKPAMMSMSTRWAEKATRMRMNEAPAMVESVSKPPVSWAADRTRAGANATYAMPVRITATLVSRRFSSTILARRSPLGLRWRLSDQAITQRATIALRRDTAQAAAKEEDDGEGVEHLLQPFLQLKVSTGIPVSQAHTRIFTGPLPH